MAIGLDIGSSAVRVAALETRRGSKPPRLTHHGEVHLPPGAVVDGDVVEPGAVADALKELWSVAGLRRRRAVAVGLASQRVTVRQIDLPDLAETELAEAVRFQAQDELPIPIDQAELDFVVVERYTVGEEQRNVRVLLVGAEREMIERVLATVAEAKLRPVRVDLDAFALLRSLATRAARAEEAEVVVDIGASVTKIAVHRGGRPLFVRMVRLGGDVATRQLQTVLELSWEDAEKAKLAASGAMAAGNHLDPDDERAQALRSGRDRVTTEVRTSLEFFRTQHESEDVKRVILSGGASLTPNLAGDLHAALNLPVERGDPLRGVELARRRGEPLDPEEAPFLGVSVGLALGLLP